MRAERRWGWLLAAPAILGFLIFTIGPMIASLFFSLTDWQIGAPARFIGLGNYHQLAHDPLFWKSLNVTTYYTLGVVPLTLLVGFVVAMLVNQGVRGRGLWRTIYYLPTLVPAVASSVLWIWIFNPDFGLLNSMLRQAGLPTSSWIYGEQSAVPSLILMSTWGFGNAMVIFLAGLQGVPRQLYEAVAIDGGGTWARFRHVTLPFMTPTIFYNLVTGTIGTFQVFNQAYIMTQGGPNNATEFYIYYLYTKAFTDSEIGYASALAWVLFVIVLVITVLLFRNARRWVYYEMGAAR
ncbi:carbohydrate ABC transporter permease [Kribbella kalugense]|jgi:multiple sugar transport system permease protein|uniref:Carbohydrate ABC transporter membrane protein 1 (CUT1 family) n=1 Tax=Kribbella kalugense TaxID=2512221 RepID=A0A4R8A2U7_9ACTN|nr:sugar ABC transporter permease [Kribbella kalugense]TDW24546.1 carbohydrate ABC transporter membrane protein 1 (CUT1 family) [Kribbella kalugense]